MIALQKFQASPLVAEAYRPPSEEMLRLLRRAPWLTSPDHGKAGSVARVSLWFLVAPMTQLTLLNFDLQAFLFLVFHRGIIAVVGHAVFMTTENLFLMATLWEFTLVRTSHGAVSGALGYALMLVVWYGAVAWRARLRGWFAVTLPVLGLLYAASGPLASFCRHTLHGSPAWGVAVSALLVGLSHAPEPMLPPRTVDAFRWIPMREYLLAPGLSAPERVGRTLHVVLIAASGAMSESWASIRLMPFNWLLMMMRLGCAKDRYREMQGWAERAWATGHPALDFVGRGGGTFLVPPDRPGQG